MGDRLVMLGHFYQRDEVIQYADFVGDSFQLAQAAKTRPAAEAIVFCGVHFMAETADMLSRPDQAVILPNLAAGCSMADMADLDSVTDCWEELEALLGASPDEAGRVPVIPVTYMNSSAAPQSLLRQARWHRLHLLERSRGTEVGLRARPACSLLPRSAPRPQHRQSHGHPTVPNAHLEPQPVVGRQHR